ncbi:MAG TPA: ATP-binding protein, partial [Bdellovibrio sp.]|nr:ATP-binding protein [Bdellovibrio sp.]
QSLSKICDQFQTQIQSVRKEKAEESFQSLPLLVRQASTELNKAVNFEMTGLNLLIDKALGQDLSEGLVHLIRNSIDHGIEDQFDRTVQGKPSFGSLKLDISERSGVIHLIFKDDGAGLDRERILRKALQSGLVREEDVPTLTEDQIHRFIFHAGFSTREKITTISGRGVGMDVVQNIVEKYGGTISISTTQGQGTEFHIEVPAPQHILVETTLLCSWQNFHLALPLASIRHITSCTELQITTVNHQRFCQFSGLTVPLLNYQEILRQRTCDLDTKVKASSAVFLSHKDFVLALIVDRVEGQTDLVVKKFGEIINEQKGFKGVSILADENIAFVIDPELLLSQMSMSAEKSEEEDAA